MTAVVVMVVSLVLGVILGVMELVRVVATRKSGDEGR